MPSRPPPRTAPPSAQGKERPGDETDGTPRQTGEQVCPDCAGTGRRDAGPCPTCRGTGMVRVTVGDA